MKQILYIVASAALLLSSCIKNDIPYPVVALQVLEVQGEGFTQSGMDPKNRVVTLALDETTDIRKVQINSVKVTDVSKMTDKVATGDYVRLSQPLTGAFDMRTPIYVTLSLYQDYDWTIRAEQVIERRFAVKGQIGASEFDLTNRIVTAKVARNIDLNHIHVTDLKLGPEGVTTTSPTLADLADADFSEVRLVEVSYHGQTEQWRLYVVYTEELVAVSAMDLWKNTASLSIAPQPAATTVVLNYKKSTETAWQATTITKNGDNTYTAAIQPVWRESTNAAGLPIYTVNTSQGVFAGHTYDYQLLVDGALKGAGQFVTVAGDRIPDGEMEDGALSCFTTQNEATDRWASGNNGFTSKLCVQSTKAGMQGNHCVKLSGSKTLGILAAGNLFSGTFVFKGMNGTANFGQKYTYTARPTTLKVKYHATVGLVDVQKNDGPLAVGEQDKARIYVCIVDWSARHGVKSGTGKPEGMWDPEKESSMPGCGNVVGYGALWIDATTAGDAMLDVEIPIHYYQKTEAAPQGNYTLIISNSTSAYGDFINGCSSNVLYVDDFRWGY
ncbi:MAG: PCMD domain-containing protein [Alistipes sp.]